MELAQKQLIGIHQIHTSLLASDIYNENINILVVHAEDHLSSTMLLLEISRELVILYEKMAEKNID